MTHIIGVTGKPGTGKSYLAKLLRRLGVMGWNADESSSSIFNTNSIQEALKKKYPQFYQGEALDRQAYFQYLWDNPKALEFLEGLMHPAIERELKAYLYENRSLDILWIEVPLLFEVHWESYCDCILVTHCNQDIAHQRLLSRGWPLDRIKALDQRYPALEQYITSGLPIIDTNGTKHETWQQLRKCIKNK